jgi:hypothetical protein
MRGLANESTIGFSSGRRLAKFGPASLWREAPVLWYDPGRRLEETVGGQIGEEHVGVLHFHDLSAHPGVGLAVERCAAGVCRKWPQPTGETLPTVGYR